MIGKRPNDLPKEIIATLPGLLPARALATAARLYYTRHWLDNDECQHFLVVGAPLVLECAREAIMGAHPPFYYLAIKPFVELSTSSFWLKLPSLVSGPPSVLLAGAGLSRLGCFGVGRGRKGTGKAWREHCGGAARRRRPGLPSAFGEGGATPRAMTER